MSNSERRLPTLDRTFWTLLMEFVPQRKVIKLKSPCGFYLDGIIGKFLSVKARVLVEARSQLVSFIIEGITSSFSRRERGSATIAWRPFRVVFVSVFYLFRNICSLQSCRDHSQRVCSILLMKFNDSFGTNLEGLAMQIIIMLECGITDLLIQFILQLYVLNLLIFLWNTLMLMKIQRSDKITRLKELWEIGKCNTWYNDRFFCFLKNFIILFW